MSIHPRHLEEDDTTEETLKTLTHLRSRFVTFSERPYIPIIDPYRPLTKEEKRWRQTHVEEVGEIVSYFTYSIYDLPKMQDLKA
ncbi:unnamed protein product [Nippostrongylus brasiliensis]|uniref:BH4_AAA_HYDROXYL_2 domain-containing protein n=1 Tax=Nippostrongylus brasiliensis TaxID=27835 RepID=A0A0N4XGK1_NIPBR|nr:unnamed protein product [Nippostrongylus brasiliensis]